MHSFRLTTRLRWWILSWFTLCLTAAVASPLLSPHRLQLVCSGSSTVKLVVQNYEGDVLTASAPSIDCPLCLLGNAPLPPSAAALPVLGSVAGIPPAAPPLVHVVARAASPPPARAPPFLFSLSQS